MTTNQTIDGVPREQMACMPVERCYDVRAKMIIAFNEAKKAGGDLDDALDAAYKSALRYSPNPMSAAQPQGVPVAPFYICAADFNRLVRDDTAIASVRVSREKRGPFTEPLFAVQPAPVAVVLPPRKHVPDFTQHPLLSKEYTGWNAYDTELKRLNHSL